jgi:hypothetical protein
MSLASPLATIRVGLMPMASPLATGRVDLPPPVVSRATGKDDLVKGEKQIQSLLGED